MAKRKAIYVTRPTTPPIRDFTECVREIWASRELTNGGPFHRELEARLRQLLKVEHMSLVSNGTLGLLLALRALDIKGEVITTPFSFVATAHSLLWNNNTPCFVDIEPDTLNIDPRKIEEAITSKTTAIMPVHCYGRPCAVDEIQSIADQHGLKVIYDAAHAFDVQCHCKSLLEHGDASVLSFHATKVFSTLEGGAVVSPYAEVVDKIEQLKNFGIVDETSVISEGLNSKMSELHAAFGLLQLDHHSENIARRRAISERYRQNLSGNHKIKIPSEISGGNDSYFPILINNQSRENRDSIYETLKGYNVYTRRYFYPLISTFEMYRFLSSSQPENLPVATKISSQVLCLPIYPDLPIEDVDYISEKLITLV